MGQRPPAVLMRKLVFLLALVALLVSLTGVSSAKAAGIPLTVTKSGTGSGTVTSSPAGINCGSDCFESYAKNTNVTLTATPAAGSTFTGWSGGNCSGTGTCLWKALGNGSTVNAAFSGGAPDTTPPTVSITAPANNATVSGTINIDASASDNVGVSGVQFKVDGGNLGAEDQSAPYTVPFNTATVADGSHTLDAIARDAAGNLGNAVDVVVTVDNVPATQCSDGVDNADPEDTLIDLADPGCVDAADNDETDPAPPSCPAGALMCTGFEDGASLSPAVVGTGTTSFSQNMIGTDLSTGFNFDTAQFYGAGQPAWGTLSVQCGGTTPIADKIVSQIDPSIGRNGTKALRQALIQDHTQCLQTAFKNKNAYTVPVVDYYFSGWLYFNPDLLTQAQTQGSSVFWRIPWQYKTTTDYRLNILIELVNNNLRWKLEADNRAAQELLPPNGQYLRYRSEPNSTAVVPTGQWFQLEVYNHRSADTNGKVQVAVNGVQIFNWTGPTGIMGVNNDPVNNFAHPILYGSWDAGSWQYVDDLVVDDLPPCGVANFPCG